MPIGHDRHMVRRSDPAGLPHRPTLTFLGAAGTVTGSRFLIETPEARVLVDCGLFQGLKPLRLRNREPFGTDPHAIDAVLLTHAHVDHCGYLPALCRDGFDGPVFATDGTRALCGIVLPDSGHLQEEEAYFANRAGYSKHHPAQPLYTEDDARRSLHRFHTVEFGVRIEVAPGVHATWQHAGHILGAASVRVELGAPWHRTILVSGDLGRSTHPLLLPPEPIGEADVVVTESTYGDRRHDDTHSVERFVEVIERTVRRRGTVVIPAFAVDRTEVILHHLARLRDEGAIPEVPVHVDSPMALNALRVYRAAIAEHRDGIRPDARLADLDWVHEVTDPEGSKQIDAARGPAIIVSASGMATGGRVLHHLERFLPYDDNAVVLAGFQAAGTRGRLLADGARVLKMHGRYVPVAAEVVHIDAFSSHADQDELVAWHRSATRAPDQTYVVHGEPTSAAALRDTLDRDLGRLAVVAHDRERVRLDR